MRKTLTLKDKNQQSYLASISHHESINIMSLNDKVSLTEIDLITLHAWYLVTLDDKDHHKYEVYGTERYHFEDGSGGFLDYLMDYLLSLNYGAE